MDGVETPQTVMTTRAPAVLITQLAGIADSRGSRHNCTLERYGEKNTNGIECVNDVAKR